MHAESEIFKKFPADDLTNLPGDVTQHLAYGQVLRDIVICHNGT
jgi:hypothetical protein